MPAPNDNEAGAGQGGKFAWGKELKEALGDLVSGLDGWIEHENEVRRAARGAVVLWRGALGSG